jgi:hypothetical protein
MILKEQRLYRSKNNEVDKTDDRRLCKFVLSLIVLRDVKLF